MLFSRDQLDQLANTNGYSINTLISEQKKLKAYQKKRIMLQDKMKEVLSSKEGGLPPGSSLLMGRINTNLLKQYGYDNIDELINSYEENDNNIDKVKAKVIKEDGKIKSSLEVLKDVDVTKDMKAQVTQEVLLDSDLAEVRNNSQEILLMLSQSKTSDEVLNVAKKQIDDNEQKLTNFLNANRLNNIKVIQDSTNNITLANKNGLIVSDKLHDLSNTKDKGTYLDVINNKISNLSPVVKNVLLVTTFGAFFGLGLSTTLKDKKPKNNNQGKDDG